VIDNFSRRVLAWKVTGTSDPNATVGILLTAAKGIGGDKPLLLADARRNDQRLEQEAAFIDERDDSFPSLPLF
jgi:hypothetical protein